MQCPSEQKCIKNFGEKAALAYPGIVHILCPPPIISGTGKGINFKFCTQIHRIDRNKSVFRTFHKSSRGHSQRLQKIFTAPICRVYHAVLLAIARLSCKRYWSSKLICEQKCKTVVIYFIMYGLRINWIWWCDC